MVKVLHSGPGHHHLGGGDCSHGHSHGDSNGHSHGHKHEHTHTHKHEEGHNDEHKDCDAKIHDNNEYKKLDVDVDMKEGYKKLLSAEVEHSDQLHDYTDARAYSLQKQSIASKGEDEAENSKHEHQNLYIDEEVGDNHKHEHKHEHKHDHKHEKGEVSDSGTDMDDNMHDHSHNTNEEENINIRAAAVHIIGDIVQSIGVIIAASIIFFKPEWQIIDPICTFLFSVLVVFTTVPVTIDCIKVLMEAAPNNMKVNEIMDDLMDLKGVDDVHDIHVWSLSVGKVALSAHITSENPLATLKRATKCIRKNYKISHTTIQVEGGANVKHSFLCSHDLHD